MTRIYGKWAGNQDGTPENETRCIKSVSYGVRTATFHQCRRKRGYGKDGLYCKQHAKQHPNPDEESKIVYLAFYEYNPTLIKVKIVSETEKRAVISKVEDIIGRSFIGSYLNKDKYQMFDDCHEAKAHLRKIMHGKIKSYQNKIKELRNELDKI